MSWPVLDPDLPITGHLYWAAGRLEVATWPVLDPELTTASHLYWALPAQELQSSILWRKCDRMQKKKILYTLLCILKI